MYRAEVWHRGSDPFTPREETPSLAQQGAGQDDDNPPVDSQPRGGCRGGSGAHHMTYSREKKGDFSTNEILVDSLLLSGELEGP